MNISANMRFLIHYMKPALMGVTSTILVLLFVIDNSIWDVLFIGSTTMAIVLTIFLLCGIKYPKGFKHISY